MKTPIPAATFLVGPLSVALLAVGALLLPGLSPVAAPEALAATAVAADTPVCTPGEGGNAACRELV